MKFIVILIYAEVLSTGKSISYMIVVIGKLIKSL